MKVKKFFFIIILLGFAVNLSAQKIDSILIVKDQYNVLVKEKRVDKLKSDRSEIYVKVSIYQSNDLVVNPSIEIRGMSFILDKSGTGLLYIKAGSYKIGCRYLPFDTNEKVRVKIRKGYDYFLEFILKKGVVTID